MGVLDKCGIIIGGGRMDFSIKITILMVVVIGIYYVVVSYTRVAFFFGKHEFEMKSETRYTDKRGEEHAIFECNRCHKTEPRTLVVGSFVSYF